MMRLLLIAALFVVLNPVYAERTQSFGLHAGVSLNENKEFYSAVFFTSHPLFEPMQTVIGKVYPRINTGLGLLWNDEKTGVVGSLGPSVIFFGMQERLRLGLGIDVALLSRTQFEETDFGSALEFISYVNIAWGIVEGLTAGYRFQHMSNAGLSSINPGLNLHVLSLEYSY
ncbi:MAG: acyloxyacyl hydrolase [Candidatus Competibacteraceae bacterium]|jgi:hypothetical protein|nr:acyloxyacyl hydrolase [Candidatus Competibacteraceae bacterium]